jgi:hypothetical protein
MSPFLARWDGEQFVPLPFFKKRLARELKAGIVIDLVETNARSVVSHRHYFACINEAWNNLPEAEQEHFPTPDELRKWCLTYTSFCDVKHYQAGSNAEALRLARILKETQDYCRTEIDGRTVRCFTPHSQSYGKMNNRTFQASKDAVFDVLARKLSVTVEELEEAGRRAA